MTGGPSIRSLALVAVGGAAGASLRHGVARAFPVAPHTFPTTTFLVNVVGAFVLALLLATLARRDVSDHWVRLLVGVGLLGGFTTFSTMAVELATLWRDGDHGLAIAYATVTPVAGMTAVVAGLAVPGARRRPGSTEDDACTAS